MSTESNYEYTEPRIWENAFVNTEGFFVDGTGTLRVVNTGGSSAGEGGMGSGSDDDRGKGDLSKSGEKGGNAVPNEDTDEGWDPIKKNIEKVEKENKKD